MKDIIPPLTGKILLHGQGIGSVSMADLEERAREIALIEGRSVTHQDRLRAKEELTRGATLSGDDADSMESLSRDPSDPPGRHGEQLPDQAAADEQKTAERLVEEGVEEAQHEQMLEARRQARRRREF